MIRYITVIACIGLASCRHHRDPYSVYDIAPAETVSASDQEPIVIEVPKDVRTSVETSQTTPSGQTLKRSIGEIVYKAYNGTWEKTYVLKKPFSFGHPRRTRDGGISGSVKAAQSTIWTSRYKDSQGAEYLTSAAVRRHVYAVKVNEDGSLGRPYYVYRIDHGRLTRNMYAIFERPEGVVFEYKGLKLRRGSRITGWGIYYVGQKGGLLQFKMYELDHRGGENREVVFEHDLGKSKEMVVRGVTVTIEELKDNGVLTYRIGK